MAKKVFLDTSDFESKMKTFVLRVNQASLKNMLEVGWEIVRLGNFQVPHDIGVLQTSGHAEPTLDGAIVGYNTRYAARLHEHPEYRFQKGRKGKYLEDPIKQNLSELLDYLGGRMKGEI